MPLPIPCPTDGDAQEHERDWLGHVEAGRIATNPGTTPAMLARHIANERALYGPEAARRLAGAVLGIGR